MAIAHNLTRPVYLSVVEDLEVDFVGGADVLRETAWMLLEALKGLAS